MDIQRFHFRSRPRRFSQKFERRIDTGIVRKAADFDTFAESGPRVALDEVVEHRFECDAVEWVGGRRRLRFVHPGISMVEADQRCAQTSTWNIKS